MHETKTDFLKKASKYSALVLDSAEILTGGLEGIYYNDSDEVHIFIFSQDDDGDDIQSHQLYSLHALLHEMRHRYHYINKIDMKETKKEIDADKFATKFINRNSEAVSKIMGWKEEWTVEEED
jgi:hypothetical protein